MSYPFAFKVVVYAGFNENTDHKYGLASGMGFAKSFADAAEQVERFYGSDLISIKNLELFEESSLLLMTEENINYYRRCDYPTLIPCDAGGNEETTDPDEGFNSISREVIK